MDEDFEDDIYDGYGAEPELEPEEKDEEEDTPTDKKKPENIENEDDKALENEEEDEKEIEEIVEPENIASKNINIVNVNTNKSSPFMTKFEFARLIAVRARQIEDNYPPHPSVPKNLINSLDIAEYELNDITIPFPFYVLRPIGLYHKKIFEQWRTRELILPKHKLIYGL